MPRLDTCDSHGHDCGSPGITSSWVRILTITDFASRYLLTCEALLTTQEKFAFTVFERTFKEFGLSQVIRTDKGVPSRRPVRSIG